MTIEVTYLSRWHWRRIERRAMAGHQRDLLATLRELGSETTPILSVATTGCAGGLTRSLSLSLPRHLVTLLGTAPRALDPLQRAETSSTGTLALTNAGRYGSLWWLAVAHGGQSTSVLGTHLYLLPKPGGDDGRGPGAGSRQVAGHLMTAGR